MPPEHPFIHEEKDLDKDPLALRQVSILAERNNNFSILDKTAQTTYFLWKSNEVLAKPLNVL